MPINKDTILSVSNLNFTYKSSIYALKSVSFTVNKGDFVGLVGHNGSGKTTLIKCILALLKPSSGGISLFGQSIKHFKLWQKIGYMPQNLSISNPIFPATVEEIIAQGLLATKHFPKRINLQDQTLIKEALEYLSIYHLKNHQIGDLSGGQQQRVFLARAIVAKPQLLILDEPSNALDTLSRQHFFDVLVELNHHQKITIILITHDIGQIGKFANKLIYIDQKIIFNGSFSDFCQSPEMSQQFGINSQHIICHQHD